MNPRPVLLAALLPLAACVPAPEGQERDIRAPAATVVGEPVNCVDTNRIQTTRVWDDYTIDFEMLGDTTYRSTLPHRCPGLGFEERFAYRTTVSRLCSADIIHVLDPDGRESGSCGLGPFVPVEVAER